MAASEVICRAVVCEEFGGPDVLAIKSKSVPPPVPGQLRVRIGAAGVNPSDTYVRLGPSGPYAGTKLLPSLPYTPGKDGAGVVEAVGSEGCQFKVGDRVYLSGSLTGTCAEYALCDESQAHRLPDNTSMAQGACLGVPAYTAYRGLVQRCRAAKGESVLIHGASGAVGLVAVQLAMAAGCSAVVGTAGTEAGMEAIRAAGAHAVCHRQEGYLQAAKAYTPGGAGFDVCLEMMASSNLSGDLSVMRNRGRVGIIGSRNEPTPVNPRDAMARELDILGVFQGSATPAEQAEGRAAILEALEAGTLRPVVGMRLPLEDASKAHAEVMAPSAGGAAGNVVLVVAEEEL